MADFATHTLFAQMPHIQAPQWVGSPVVRNWGLQGPDVFFFRRVITGGSPLYHLGTELHNTLIARQFEEMARYVNTLPQSQRDLGIAYFYGYLCHYCVDSTLHPYVEYHVGRLKTGFPELTTGAIHCQIETDIDTDLYTYLRRVPVNRFRPGELYTISREQSELIGCILSVTVFNTYGTVLPATEAMAAVDDTLRVQKGLFAPTKLVHAAAGLAEVLLHKDGDFTCHVKAYKPKWDSLNLRGSGWYSPYEPGRRRTDNVPELLEQAAEKAEKLVAAYDSMFQSGRIHHLDFDVDYGGEPIAAGKA